jgi:hypothetical protein
MTEPDEMSKFVITEQMRRDSPITAAAMEKMQAEEQDLGEVIGGILGALLEIEASIPRPSSGDR